MDGYVKGTFIEKMQLVEKPLNEKLYDLQMYALDAAETPLDASYDAAMKVYCNTEDSEIKEKAKISKKNCPQPQAATGNFQAIFN